MKRCLPAKSEFALLEYQPEGNVSLARVAAGAARRHQIRAHARYLGHPLIGDALYASTRQLREVVAGDAELPPFFLHAEMICFRHPTTGRELRCTAPFPAFIRESFPTLRGPSSL
jgi:23S rRNA pseudouridine1911/1915/1917 synthase